MRCFSAKTHEELGASHTNFSSDQSESFKSVDKSNGIRFLYSIAEGILKGDRSVMNRIA